MQISVSVQKSPEEGGLNGDSIFIDTDGSFVVDRLKEIASSFDVNLDRIHYFRIFNASDLLGLLDILETNLVDEAEQIEDHEHINFKNVKLVVIDSLTNPFKSYQDMSKRYRDLGLIGSS